MKIENSSWFKFYIHDFYGLKTFFFVCLNGPKFQRLKVGHLVTCTAWFTPIAVGMNGLTYLQTVACRSLPFLSASACHHSNLYSETLRLYLVMCCKQKLQLSCPEWAEWSLVVLTVHKIPVCFYVWFEVMFMVCVIPKLKDLINHWWLARLIVPGSPLIWIVWDDNGGAPKIGPVVSPVVHDCTDIWTKVPTLTISLPPSAKSQLLLFLRMFIL